jgi:arginase
MENLLSRTRLETFRSPSLDLIVAPWGFGGTDNLAQEGAHSLLVEKELVKKLKAIECEVHLKEPPGLGPFEIQEETQRIRNIDAINQVNSWLADHVQNSIEAKHIPIVLGGDGSLSIGSVMGLLRSEAKRTLDTQKQKNLGIIWINNHFCNSSPRVTKSWNANRMAFRALTFDKSLENAHPDFKSLIALGSVETPSTPILQESNVVHLGIGHRSAQESATHVYFTMEDIDELGARHSILRAIEALKHCGKIHVIWDVNSLDLSGVSNPSLGQLTYREALSIARTLDLNLRRTNRLSSIDIVEHCPSREAWDKRGETGEWMTDIIANIFGENIFNAARKY